MELRRARARRRVGCYKRSAEEAKRRSKGCSERRDGWGVTEEKRVIECLADFYPELNESSLIDEVIAAVWKNELFFPSAALSKIKIESSKSEKIAASWNCGRLRRLI